MYNTSCPSTFGPKGLFIWNPGSSPSVKYYYIPQWVKGVGSCVFPSNCVGSDGLLLGEVRFYHSFGVGSWWAPRGLLCFSRIFT